MQGFPTSPLYGHAATATGRFFIQENASRQASDAPPPHILLQAMRQDLVSSLWNAHCHRPTPSACTMRTSSQAGFLSVCRKMIPYLLQAVKQGFQDLGARDQKDAQARLANGLTRLECRTGAAQAEGNVHDMYSYEKVRW